MTPRLLLVCRANLCRSPSAEVLLRVALHERGVDADVSSAGVEAVEGQEAPAAFYEEATSRGIELRDRRPVALSTELSGASDLVLPMTRDLLRSLVVDDPSLWPRAFTLLELVRRGESLGAPDPREDLSRWIARLHASRDRIELLGSDPLDDVRDPLGDPEAGAEAMFVQLDDATRRLAGLLAGLSG